jgi:hypothetical protein
MKTLKQKLKHIPSPIREMIVENIEYSKWKIDDSDNGIKYAFAWHSSKHIRDYTFWVGIHEEILLIK